jgi:hypothetical protein
MARRYPSRSHRARAGQSKSNRIRFATIRRELLGGLRRQQWQHQDPDMPREARLL